MDMSESVNGGRAGSPKCPRRGNCYANPRFRTMRQLRPNFFSEAGPIDRTNVAIRPQK